jgi:hypothetical protein
MHHKIDNCRICGNDSLVCVLDLGEQVLTGVFPKDAAVKPSRGPLRLVKCMGPRCSGLVQLEHSYDLAEMYGLNYGYRSGLNPSMVSHLQRKVQRILSLRPPRPGALIVDIGSNDSTTLQAYPAGDYELVGIDPTGVKFREYYPPHIALIPEFFSAKCLAASYPGRKATIVTSFSMFYDLESPLAFMREIAEVLEDDGIWVFEQSYMPTMLATNSYDTVCHEHLEFYALRQIKWLTDLAGLVILDVEFNDVNGGSFSITATKSASGLPEGPMVDEILRREAELGLDTLAPFEAFAARAAASRSALLEFIDAARADGKRVAALGASTKGNVLLQYCGLGPDRIEAIGEVNSEKFGCFTPGTLIPIRPEAEVLASDPDYLLVLPWHFRKFFLSGRELRGRTLVFPLPDLEVVLASSD